MARKQTVDLPEALRGVEFTRRADELVGLVRNWLQRTEGVEEDPQVVADLSHALVDERLSK